MRVNTAEVSMKNKERNEICKLKYEGKVFQTKFNGDVVVLQYENSKNVKVKFLDTGNIVTTSASHLNAGLIKDKQRPSVCGVGICDILCSRGGESTKEYVHWAEMLNRCYSKARKRTARSYSSCEVSETFKYLSKFSKWCNEQIGFNFKDDKGKPFQLDKDILIKGNKIYSEETCAFVPQEVNLLFVKREKSRGDCPIGVRFYKGSGMFRAIYNHKQSEHFKTPEEAFCVYKEAKEAYVKEVANKWKDQIDPRVYEALMKYQVEITD